jgi:hypothetical protein
VWNYLNVPKATEIISVTIFKMKDCEEGKYRHHVTKRCRKIESNNTRIPSEITQKHQIHPQSPPKTSRVSAKPFKSTHKVGPSGDRLKTAAMLVHSIPGIKVALFYAKWDSKGGAEVLLRRKSTRQNTVVLSVFAETSKKMILKKKFEAKDAASIVEGITDVILGYDADVHPDHFSKITVVSRDSQPYCLYDNDKRVSKDKVLGPKISRPQSPTKKIIYPAPHKKTFKFVLGPNDDFDL